MKTTATENISPNKKLSFFGFIKEYFTNYTSFISTWMEAEKPPFLLLVIWLVGMASAISRMNRNSEHLHNDWGYAWGSIALAGIVLGSIAYWFTGFIYNLGVMMSGGNSNVKISRRLALYSLLPAAFVTIFARIFDTIVYGNKYFTDQTNHTSNYIWMIIGFAGGIYTLTLSYIGVRLLLKTKLVRSVLFFILVPIAFVLLVTFLPIYIRSLVNSKGINYNAKALAEMYKGNYSEAERLYNEAIKNTDKDDTQNIITIYNNLGILCRNKNEPEKAITAYEKVLALCKPTEDKYHSTLGKINILRGLIPDAIKNFEEALKINPDNFGAHNDLGLIFLGEMDDNTLDYEKALIHNKKAHELNRNTASIGNLALNYYCLGKYSNALPLYEELNKTSPDNSHTKYFLGVCYYHNNEMGKAKKSLTEAIKLNPKLDNENSKQILEEINGNQK
jgi:tetratricopeptide (TPR) repeat protein